MRRLSANGRLVAPIGKLETVSTTPEGRISADFCRIGPTEGRDETVWLGLLNDFRTFCLDPPKEFVATCDMMKILGPLETSGGY
jgi:hypothetical protein